MILISDRPISKREDAEKAQLDICDEIVSSILSYKSVDPITLHINGAWGSGKSSCLNLIRNEFDNQRDKFFDLNGQLYLTASFNPWNVIDKTQLTSEFFSTLSATFHRNKVKKFMEKSLKISSTIASLLGKEKLSQQLSALKDYIKLTNQSESNNTLSESKEKIQKKLETSSFKRLIFIDEIDRLQAEEIAIVFQLINNVCDLPNLIFIIAFDQEIVSSSLAEYLSKIKSEKTFSGKITTDKSGSFPYGNAKITDAGFFPAESKVELVEKEKSDVGDLYLQKIIQYRFNVPVLKRLERYSILEKSLLNFNIMDKKDITTFDVEIKSIPLSSISSFNYPRQIKRLCSYFVDDDHHLEKYINFGDIILLKTLKFFYPSTYNNFLNYLNRIEKEDSLYQLSIDIQKDYSRFNNADSNIIINYLVNRDDKSMLEQYSRLFSRETSQLYLHGSVEGLISLDYIKRVSENPIDSNWLQLIPKEYMRYAFAQLNRCVKEDPLSFSSDKWLDWYVKNAFSFKIDGDETVFSPALFGELLGNVIRGLDDNSIQRVINGIINRCSILKADEKLASFLHEMLKRVKYEKQQSVADTLSNSFSEAFIQTIVFYSKSLKESPSGFNNMLDLLHQLGKLSQVFAKFNSFSEDEKMNFMCNCYALYSSRRDALNFSPPTMGVFGFRDNADNELNSIRNSVFYKNKMAEISSMKRANLSTLYCYLWPQMYSFERNGFSGESIESRIDKIKKNNVQVNNDI